MLLQCNSKEIKLKEHSDSKHPKQTFAGEAALLGTGEAQGMKAQAQCMGRGITPSRAAWGGHPGRIKWDQLWWMSRSGWGRLPD